ncbi:unnamed protein product [Orchesella dallaii]|uniref:lysoplasmalogenase n=1 Tax=Orchesella dallaii TaxID=48710 RepID=A0ABP1PUV1_9HEXA
MSSSGNPLNVFKYVGPRLVPFLKTLGLYFVIFIPDDRPSLFAMTLKCLPVVSLALFIVLHGIGLSDEHKFSRRILIGLVFSCLGDAFLIWPSYFLHGMAAFAVAQSFYIRAFGFQPMKWKLGLAVYAITSSNLGLILPTLLGDATSMVIGVLIYSFLLTTMLWRAIARVEFSWTEFSWSKLSSCIGAIFFAISDTILALNQFYTRIPYHQTLVMATYYIAQLGIALSVVTTKEQSPTDVTEEKSLPAADNNELKSNLSLRQRKNKVQI